MCVVRVLAGRHAFVAPFIVPLVYASFGEGVGFTVVFIMLASAFAVVAVVIALFGMETKGKPLSDTSDEKVGTRAMEMDEAAI